MFNGKWYWGNNIIGRRWKNFKWYQKVIVIILELLVIIVLPILLLW